MDFTINMIRLDACINFYIKVVTESRSNLKFYYAQLWTSQSVYYLLVYFNILKKEWSCTQSKASRMGAKLQIELLHKMDISYHNSL